MKQTSSSEMNEGKKKENNEAARKNNEVPVERRGRASSFSFAFFFFFLFFDGSRFARRRCFKLLASFLSLSLSFFSFY